MVKDFIPGLKAGDRVTIVHETYGTLNGVAHWSGSTFYLPFGFGHINLNSHMERQGWHVADGDPLDRVAELCRTVDRDSHEALQAWLADEILAVLGRGSIRLDVQP